MGAQTIIFGGKRVHFDADPLADSQLDGYMSTEAETEVWDFETGESRIVAPTLSQEDSFGLAIYFVDDAKFCEGQASSIPTWVGGGMNPNAIEW